MEEWKDCDHPDGAPAACLVAWTAAPGRLTARVARYDIVRRVARSRMGIAGTMSDPARPGVRQKSRWNCVVTAAVRDVLSLPTICDGYLRDLRAICDGAISSVSICVICGLCDGAMVICADLRYLRFLRMRCVMVR